MIQERKMARKRRKKRVTRMRIAAVTLLGIVIAAVVFIGVFRIRSVELLGSERHDAETIKNDLIYNFWTENTLWFCWKYRNAAADPGTPYLESIQAKLLSPGKVRLTVKEKQLSGYVQYAGDNVYFDKNGTVLEITGEVYQDIPLVSGITMETPVLYQKIPIENAAQLGAMLKITDLLIKAEFIPDNIAFDENLNITLTVGTVTVKLGQNSCLDEKVANLVTIYPSIAGQTGTLNMEAFTGKEYISFQPSEEAQETGENNGGENGEAAEGEGSSGTEDDSGQEGTSADGDESTAGEASGTGEDGTVSGETTGVSAFMAFDSSGTLRYDAHVVNGQVVDANGYPIDGCYVNEAGNVVDAYWNEIDPNTGELAQ